MTTPATFLTQALRIEDIEHLKAVMPQCVQAAAQEVGLEGLKAFFDGYKDSLESQKLAA